MVVQGILSTAVVDIIGLQMSLIRTQKRKSAPTYRNKYKDDPHVSINNMCI